MRHAVVVEHDETVINRVETELGTDIANSDAWQGTVVFKATDLNAERMRAIVFAVEDKASHDNGVVGSLAKTANPPFGSSKCRRMNLEFVGLVNVSGSCFQTLDVGSVSNLSERLL